MITVQTIIKTSNLLYSQKELLQALEKVLYDDCHFNRMISEHDRKAQSTDFIHWDMIKTLWMLMHKAITAIWSRQKSINEKTSSSLGLQVPEWGEICEFIWGLRRGGAL